eukprot:220816-Prymnesium_polylepis.1
MCIRDRCRMGASGLGGAHAVKDAAGCHDDSPPRIRGERAERRGNALAPSPLIVHLSFMADSLRYTS